MSWVEFEPTIPAFERAKTLHALDRTATVTGSGVHMPVGNSNIFTQDFSSVRLPTQLMTYSGCQNGLTLLIHTSFIHSCKKCVKMAFVTCRNMWPAFDVLKVVFSRERKQTLLSHVGIEALTTVVMKSSIFEKALSNFMSQKIKFFCYHSTMLCYSSNSLTHGAEPFLRSCQMGRACSTNGGENECI
jgi:hypothetical protein